MTTTTNAGMRVLCALGVGEIAFIERDADAAGPGEIAGMTLFTLISAGTELAMSALPREQPMSLGYAAVFRVDELGEGVTDWAVGDVAFAIAPHATRQRVATGQAIRCDPSLDPGTATFARIMNIALSALSSARPAVGAVVGVSGLGVVGQIAARVSVASGFRTVAADVAESRRALCPPGIAVAADLPASSLDLVLECTGHESRVIAAAGSLREGGELSLVGVPWRPRDAGALHPLMDLVFHRYLTVRSGWEWQVPWEAGTGGSLPSMREQLSLAVRWLTDGVVRVDDLAETISASKAPWAYDALRRREAPRLTYLLDWT